MVNAENLESIVERFESALLADSATNLQDFAPDPRDDDYFVIVTELIRTDMELRWDSDHQRKVADYKELFPTVLSDPHSLDRIAFEEYRLRISSGENVSIREYEEQYSTKLYHWPMLRADSDSDQPTHAADSEEHLFASGLFSSADSDSTQVDLAGRMIGGRRSGLPTLEKSLHKRLTWIGIAIVASLFYLSFLAWNNPRAKVGLFLGSSWLIWLNGICLFVSVSVCVVLWVRRSISISKLRYLEFILFGSVLLELSCGLASDLFVDRELAGPIIQGEHELFHYSSSWSLPFFALIVAYGTVVPSGWRRCTVVVSIMGLLPIAISSVAEYSLHGFNAGFLRSFLMQMVLWMVIAGSIAIYGVRRLEENQLRLIESGKLGKYRLIRQIAVGGMAQVFQAEDTMLNRQCAIKLINPTWATRPDQLARFEREVQVLAGISHANIVQIHDFGFTENGVFYYVMELLEGKNMEQAIREGEPFSTEKTITILSEVGEALKLIHDGGVIHRDIKPSNIFVAKGQNDRALSKLLDFGLIKSSADLASDDPVTQDGMIVGTPAYMSPEQALGREVDLRSDLYSLGAVAYFAVTGRKVFDESNMAETLTAHIRRRPKPMFETTDDTGSHLQEIVLRCLAKDPDCRFQSASEFLQALEAIGSEPIPMQAAKTG